MPWKQGAPPPGPAKVRTRDGTERTGAWFIYGAFGCHFSEPDGMINRWIDDEEIVAHWIEEPPLQQATDPPAVLDVEAALAKWLAHWPQYDRQWASVPEAFEAGWKSALEPLNVINNAAASDEKIRDLRDVVRLIIGRKKDIPWYEIPEREVDGYLADLRELKKLKPPPACG